MISDETIKDILRNRDIKLESIQTRMMLLYEETDESLLKEIVLPGSRNTGMPTAKWEKRDLSSLIQTIEHRRVERGEEIREIMWQLSEEESMINRVWVCFCALEEPYFSILQMLYVKNEKYETVEKTFDMSHKTFEKKRADGIRLLKQYYESESSAADLMRKRFSQSKKKSRKKTGNRYEQLTLF